MANRRIWIVGAVVLVLIVVGAIGAVLLGGTDSDDPGEEAADASPETLIDESDDPLDPTATLARQPTLTPLPSPTWDPAVPTPTSLPFSVTAVPSPTPYNSDLANDVRLDIPKLDYIRPIRIVELPVQSNTWDVTNLGYNIGWLDQTTWLEPDWGNTVLVGHVNLSAEEEGPFYYLFLLENGDEIVVYEDGVPTTYIVYETITVAADAMEVTYPTRNPILTLMTCTNWDEARGAFSERRIVRAYPLGTTDLPDMVQDSVPAAGG
jgi:sortase A